MEERDWAGLQIQNGRLEILAKEQGGEMGMGMGKMGSVDGKLLMKH